MPVHNQQRRSIREAYSEASSFLRQRGVMEPESNAERLLEYALGETRSGMLLRWAEPFPAERERLWRELLDRKAAGEPVQYMIGEQEFYGLPFRVTPAVLIPRPETELLVEELIRVGRMLWPETSEAGAGPIVCDIGTGSGAIAVTLAVQCPDWRLLASDLSSAALEVAQDNAERLGAAKRITFEEGDLLAPWIARGESIDILVSNPPYIPDADEAGLQPEVRLYEPRTALYGGADGLQLYRRMTGQLAGLASGVPQVIGFEVGMGQAEAVKELLEPLAAWDEIRIIPDLAGIGRHVVAYRRKK